MLLQKMMTRICMVMFLWTKQPLALQAEELNPKQLLTKEQIVQARELFSLFERRSTGTGKVPTSALGDILSSLQADSSQATLKELTPMVDPDDEGFFDFDAFLKMMTRVFFGHIALMDPAELSEYNVKVNKLSEMMPHFESELSALEVKELFSKLGEEMTEKQAQEILRDVKDMFARTPPGHLAAFQEHQYK